MAVSKFVETPTMKEVLNMFSKCEDCVHYMGVLKCKAFDAIPDEIFLNKVEHDKVRNDQKGDYVFTPKPKTP